VDRKFITMSKAWMLGSERRERAVAARRSLILLKEFLLDEFITLQDFLSSSEH
jgi:hypothetical protein